MSKLCPIYGRAIYADCLDCDTKMCEGIMYNTIVIGIDQSYNNTGISISADGVLKVVKSLDLSKYNSNSEKRMALKKKLRAITNLQMKKANNIICVIERIRLQSKGFLNIDYIKSIGALNAVIVDVMNEFGVKVYSVDTRCWKSQVVGTSKPEENIYGVKFEKWPTVKWCILKGFEDSILINVTGSRKTRGTYTDTYGNKYMYDNDAADSAAISMFYFVGDKNKLKEEH
jgi:hypothetical protein